MTPKQKAQEASTDEVTDEAETERAGGPGPEEPNEEPVSGAGTYMLNPRLWAIGEVKVGDKTLRHGEPVSLTAGEVKEIRESGITAFGDPAGEVLVSA